MVNSAPPSSRWSGPLPSTLFKYYRFNEYSERLFTHSEVYFPSPAAFNDPFDCRVRIDFTSTADEQREFLDDLLTRTHQHLTDAQRLAMAEHIVGSGLFFTQAMTDAFVADLQAAVNRTGVFCLTAVPDSILMWAHYADCHRGFCAEYQATERPSIRNQDTFQPSPTSPVYRLDHRPYALYSSESLFFNPHGMWHLQILSSN